VTERGIRPAETLVLQHPPRCVVRDGPGAGRAALPERSPLAASPPRDSGRCLLGADGDGDGAVGEALPAVHGG